MPTDTYAHSLTSSSATAVSATRWYSFAGKTVAHRTGNGLAGVTSVVTDPQGSVVGTVHNTDWASGVSRKRPDPFGGARSSGSVTSQGRGFLGAVHDSNALVLLGARFFDPGSGVFVSVDPLLDPGNPAQFNAYVYAGNNPVTWSDPSGLAWTGPVADGGDHRYVAKSKTSSRAGVGNPPTLPDPATERTCSRGRVPVCASKATFSQTVTVAHLVLSVVGLFHEAGDIADGALSLAEGDPIGAGVSVGAAAPLAGIAAGFGKIGKYWDKLFGAGTKARKVAPESLTFESRAAARAGLPGDLAAAGNRFSAMRRQRVGTSKRRVSTEAATALSSSPQPTTQATESCTCRTSTVPAT